jgi:anti-anti-sigma factor
MMTHVTPPESDISDVPTPTSDFELTTDRHGSTHIVRVTGPLGPAYATRVRTTVEELLTNDPAEVTIVVLDLTEVSVLTAAGLDVLFAAQRASEDRLDLRIVAATEPVLAPMQATDVIDRNTVYSSVEEALGTDREPIGVLRAKLQQRERQLASQPAIEQAKGMLMQDFRLTPDEAFGVLQRLSQDSNTKLRSVAERLVDELQGTVSDKTAQATADAIAELRRDLGEET